jgi:ketosteroid isomerase-like protein
MIRRAAPLLLLLAAAAPAPPTPQTKAQAQAEIWTKEQAIYRERGKGNLGPYIDNVATDYLAWPPFSATPTGVGDLRRTQPKMAVENHELLAMEFVAFAMNGDAAVIYYKTHRTRLPTGAPADERFEVTHSWVRQDGQWKVYGGMARAQPARP